MHPLSKISVALLVAGSLSACTNLAPNFEYPESPVANSISGITDLEVQPQIELAAWREFFPSPDVRQLIELALGNNRDLRIAAANVAEAQGLYQIQQREYLPDIGINGAGTSTRNSTNLTGDDNISRSYSANVGLVSYEIDFWGRIRNLNDAALASYFGTLEAQRSSQLSIISETANAYYNWLAATENLRLADETLESRKKSMELIKLRETVGISSALDIAQAQVALVTVEAQRAQNQRTLSNFKAALELLVGTPIDQLLANQKNGHKPEFKLQIPDNLDSSILLSRPDIIRSEEALRAANANIGAARAAFFPRVSLVGSTGLASSDLSDLFGSGSSTWTFTPSIALPLFGNSNQANLDVAKARQQRSVAEYEKAIQTAFSEVYTNAQARIARRAEIDANTRLVTAQQDRLKLAEARYRAGLDSYTEVLDSQQNLFSAEQALLESERGEVEAVIQLYKALGGGDNTSKSFRELHNQAEQNQG